MKRNQMTFSQAAVEKGALNQMIQILRGQYVDESIHSYPLITIRFEEDYTILEWAECYDQGCTAEILDVDERVYKEIRLPDDTYVDIPAETDEKEFINDWLKDNPGWERTSYGTWTFKG